MRTKRQPQKQELPRWRYSGLFFILLVFSIAFALIGAILGAFGLLTRGVLIAELFIGAMLVIVMECVYFKLISRI
jgi:hypothetical protein